MNNIYYINGLYRITEGILAGYSGVLVAYDATTDDAIIRIEDGVTINTKGESIALIQKKYSVPRKKRFLVCNTHTTDTLVFNVPKELSEDDFNGLLYTIGHGETVEINDSYYGWLDQSDLPAVVGIVEATTAEEAISIFDYNPHTLVAYELA